MTIDTGEFRALSDLADEYRHRETLLIKTVAALAGAAPEPPQTRPQFTVLEGGRQ